MNIVSLKDDERVIEKRIYPWDGHWVRNPQENQGHPEVKSVKINAKRKPIITISLHRASAP